MENTNYFFNSKDNSFDKVLDSLSTTEVHSYKTSSLPLADFWNPRNKILIDELLSEIAWKTEEYKKSEKIFEFPVQLKNEDNSNLGKPSMTDLMIRYEVKNNVSMKQIAIEGKFTEPLYETIEEWRKTKSENSKKDFVLNGWYDLIKDYCSILDKDSVNKEVVYQFLHRTASACYKTNKPYLLYQLFYDAYDLDSIQHQIEVAKKIQKFAKEYLRFNKGKISFFVCFTPIVNIKEVDELYSSQKSSLFLLMKKNPIYYFGDSTLVDCLTNDITDNVIKLYQKESFSNTEFVDEYEELWKKTWHRGQSQEDYLLDLKQNYPNLYNTNRFNKDEAKIDFNPENDQEDEKYKKDELIERTEKKIEEWRFLNNPGYTKYAVSDKGRVAFLSGSYYHILSQDDKNNDGYLRLDPDEKYTLDHQIEVYKLIAMGFHGKRIGDNYDVHHIVNNGYNCRPDNLVLLTRVQHNAVHMSEEQHNKYKDNIMKYLEDEES